MECHVFINAIYKYAVLYAYSMAYLYIALMKKYLYRMTEIFALKDDNMEQCRNISAHLLATWHNVA